MVQTIKAYETNKNAVITHFSCPCPTKGERPISNVVWWNGFYIFACVFDHYFSVYKHSGDKVRQFKTLAEAKRFIISQFDNRLNFSDL